MHTSGVRNNALRDLTLIKLNVVRFKSTVGFLIGYSIGHTKEAQRQLTFKRRIKFRLPFSGIIRSSPYSTSFQDKG